MPKIKLKSIAQLRKTRFKSTTSPLKASWQVAATPEYRYAQQGMFSFPSASTLGCEGGQREEKCLSVAKKWLALLLDFSGQLSVCCERSRPALETGTYGRNQRLVWVFTLVTRLPKLSAALSYMVIYRHFSTVYPIYSRLYTHRVKTKTVPIDRP